MSYNDLYFTTQNDNGAIRAYGARKGINMIGPSEGRLAVIEDGEEICPAAGAPGTFYFRVRTKQPGESVVADLVGLGAIVASQDEVSPVVGVWA